MSDDTVTLGSGVYVEYVAMMASMGLWGITCMQTYVFTSSDVMPIGRSMLILTFRPVASSTSSSTLAFCSLHLHTDRRHAKMRDVQLPEDRPLGVAVHGESLYQSLPFELASYDTIQVLLLWFVVSHGTMTVLNQPLTGPLTPRIK